MDKVDHKEGTIAALLSNIMVRHTRVDVLRWYSYDAKTHKREDPVIYDPYRPGPKGCILRLLANPNSSQKIFERDFLQYR